MARTLLTTLSPTRGHDFVDRLLTDLSHAIVAAHVQIDHSGAHLLTGHREPGNVSPAL